MYKSTCRKHFQHDLSLNSIIKVRILAILKGQVTYELGFTRSVELLFVAISPGIWLFNVTSWTYLGCFNGDVQVTYEPIAGREELGCTQGVELPSVAVWPGSLFFQWRRDLFGALLNYILNETHGWLYRLNWNSTHSAVENAGSKVRKLFAEHVSPTFIRFSCVICIPRRFWAVEPKSQRLITGPVIIDSSVSSR